MKRPNPLILSLLTLASCAVREAPPGGPEDLTPPSIVAVTPEGGSTNLAPGIAFRIRFSEPMNREKVETAIFLSPVFWDYPKLEWSGRELTITPPQSLRPNTTYILTIGADAIDAHGVKMGRSLNFAFSTGAVIDSGSISGNIYYEGNQRVIYDIWAYALSDTALDFTARIPDYATQVDSTGSFSVEHLGAGRFLVVAVEDKNDDLFWDPSAEEIGLPPSEFELSAGEIISGIVLRPSRMDTATAYVSGVDPLNNHRIKIEFSAPPERTHMLDPQSYRVCYLDSDSILQTGAVYIGENGQLMLETDPLREDVLYRLIPQNLRTASGALFDTAGARFSGVDFPDTVGPRLIASFPPDRSANFYQDSIIELTFSERLLSLPFPDAVIAVADSVDTLRFAVVWPQPNVARLQVSGGIPRQREISVTLDPSKVYDIDRNRMPDSTMAFIFRLPPADTVGAVTATMETSLPGPHVGKLTPMTRGETYKGRFDSGGRFEIETVMPGSYRFEFFQDADSGLEWSPGSINGFRFAEPFSFLPDTIQVRSRWETDIGPVKLPKVD